MNQPRVLVTGGYGCIGSETIKWLLRNSSAEVVLCSRQVNEDRTARVFHDVEISRITCMPVDVRDEAQLLAILQQHEISHVVHLAALQTPDCNAHRDLGLQINLAGTQKLVEAMKASGVPLKRFVFASSIAVYGPRSIYPPGPVPMLAEPQPVNVYGAWKLAGEHVSRYFHKETGIPTLCLRPGVLFGPGRDAGLTSSPTTAMKCVALDMPYEIPFRTKQDYLYAPDVGAAFGNALLEPFDGFGVFTLPSHTVETAKIVELLGQAAAALNVATQMQITIGTTDVPFISELVFDEFCRRFPATPRTPLAEAVRESLEVFLAQVQRGWLTIRDVQ